MKNLRQTQSQLSDSIRNLSSLRFVQFKIQTGNEKLKVSSLRPRTIHHHERLDRRMAESFQSNNNAASTAGDNLWRRNKKLVGASAPPRGNQRSLIALSVLKALPRAPDHKFPSSL